MDLATFLADVAGRPLEWGRCDCCLMVADWISDRTGRDPAADLRATYVDEAGAARRIAAEGGLAALFARRLARAGLARTAAPQPGDVAIVAIGALRFGAIATASGWAIKTRRGLILSRAPRRVACWSVADA